MKKFFKILCFQTKSSKDPHKNINMLEEIFKSVSVEVDLICLPECVAVFSDEKKTINLFLNKFRESFFNLIKQQAVQRKCCIQIGSIPEKFNDKKFVNRSYVIDEKGSCNSFYDKINLFDVKLNDSEYYSESKNYVSGKKIVVSDLPIGKLGMSICYDLRFPNMYRKMAKKGAIYLSIPSAFTETTGKRHWHTLLKARAIENFSYVFAPGQAGKHCNGRKTYGHSMIVSPDGKILKELGKREGVITTTIDPKKPIELRKTIPSIYFD